MAIDKPGLSDIESGHSIPGSPMAWKFGWLEVAYQSKSGKVRRRDGRIRSRIWLF